MEFLTGMELATLGLYEGAAVTLDEISPADRAKIERMRAAAAAPQKAVPVADGEAEVIVSVRQEARRAGFAYAARYYWAKAFVSLKEGGRKAAQEWASRANQMERLQETKVLLSPEGENPAPEADVAQGKKITSADARQCKAYCKRKGM